MTHIETKHIIRQALESNDLDAIVSLARQNRRVLSQLLRMAYDKETLVGWRAIKAIGRTAGVLVKTDLEFLRETARKLLWSLSDESGGIGWSAPEVLGEIVSSDPEKFADVIPLIAEVYNVEEQVFKPGVLYALGRIAEISPERVADYQKIIIMSLVNKDPLVEIYALELVEYLWKAESYKLMWSEEYCRRIIKGIQNLVNNKEVGWIYKNNNFIDIQVGEKAKKLVELMSLS